MSLLSSFISEQLIKAVEYEFQSHGPDMQSFILDEVKAFLLKVNLWVESKINNSTGDK